MLNLSPACSRKTFFIINIESMEYTEVDGVRYFKLHDTVRDEGMSNTEFAICIVLAIIILGLMCVGFTIIG